MTLSQTLCNDVLAGRAAAVGRACRIVDERGPGHLELLTTLYPHALSSWFVGVTGSPGVGKSTLVSRLIQHYRSSGLRVGVVAVDPSSPFSGGAILGDRIRMQEHFGDPEVFIRSVATRGALGGLSRTASDVARVLAAWGADIVLIETVGVGQDELDVMRVAHTTLVVQAPGAGDELQASKAGLMECADVFAVNKADRSGAEAAVRHLRAMIALGQLVGSDRLVAARGHSAAAGLSSAEPEGQGSEGAETWVPCVVSCSATAGLGVDELAQRLSEHRAWLEASEAGRRRRLSRLADELASRIRDALSRAIFERNGEEIEQAALRIVSAATDPYSASRDIVEGLLRRGPSPGH